MKFSIRLRGIPVLPLVLVFCLLGFFLTPYDPGLQDFREHAFAGPSLAHPLGVDALGRDFLSRLWRGAAHTTGMGAAALVATLIWSTLLLWAAQAGPTWMRRSIPDLIGLWVAVPVIFIGLILLVFLAPSAGALILAASLGNVPLAYRQLDVLWRAQRSAPYVESSMVLGASGLQLLRFAIWPNLKPDLLALARLLFAISVLELSGLSFLGLIGDPDFPELGAILKQNQAFLHQAPMLVFVPGVILSSLLLFVHLSGHRMRNETAEQVNGSRRETSGGRLPTPERT